MKKIKKFFSRIGIWFKKYSSVIVLILFGAVAILITCLIWVLTRKKVDENGTEVPLPMKTMLDIKDRINEANIKAAIEITAAKTEDEKIHEELKKISKIKERKDRMMKLMALYEVVHDA